MRKICLVALLLLFLFMNTAYAQNFDVLEISADHSVAVLLDRDEGIEWAVVEGDEIAGWTIISIDQLGVTIKKEPEGDMPYAIVHTLSEISKNGFAPEPHAVE